MPIEERAYRSRIVRRHHPHHKPLTKTDADLVLRYLKNPTGVGVVKLEAEWLSSGGIVDSFKQLKVAGSKADDEVDSRRLERAARLLDDVNSIFGMFNYLVRIKNKSPKDTETRYSDEAEYLLDAFDLKPLLKKYSDALEYFEKHLHFENNTYERRQNSLIKTRSGIILTPGRYPDDNSGFFAISLDQKPLGELKEFLNMIEKIDQAVVYTAFSPEEDLLEPYIDLTSICIEHLPMSGIIRRHFKKAIGDFYDQNFTGAVSTSSLVAEECLSQVYETIARAPVPKSLTLGQLSQRIGVTSKNIDTPKTMATQKTKSDILKKIGSIKYDKDQEKYARSISKLVLDYVDQHNENLKREWTKAKEGDVNFNIFPELIKLSLDDLITYRNAASHKSTDPIDSLKALKSIYASLSMAIWWEGTRKTIDGSKSTKEVYDSLVILAKSYS